MNVKCDKLGNMKKTNKKGTYFDPYPQIKILNEKGCARRKNFFLPNRFQCAVVKCDGVNIKIINTCPFDCIIHILQFAAIDDSNYLLKIKESGNKMLQFLANFIQTGAMNSVLLQRCKLLKELHPLTSVKNGNTLTSYRSDARVGVTNVWEKLSMGPSGIRRSECNIITCRVKDENKVSYLVVNHLMIADEGFQSLGRALDLHCSWKCRNCNGVVNEVLDLNDLLFIKLDIRPSINHKVGLQCNL